MKRNRGVNEVCMCVYVCIKLSSRILQLGGGVGQVIGHVSLEMFWKYLLMVKTQGLLKPPKASPNKE